MDVSDRDDFEAFMVSRWPRLVRLAYGLTGDRQLAEDVTQTALASAYASWRRVRGADDPDAYVRRIVVNVSRRRFRGRRGEAEIASPVEVLAAESSGGDPAGPAGLRSDLLSALAGLPPRQRAVVVLRYWEDLTDAQAAAVLGCSASTVRSQAARALAKLRGSAALTEQDPHPDGGRR